MKCIVPTVLGWRVMTSSTSSTAVRVCPAPAVPNQISTWCAVAISVRGGSQSTHLGPGKRRHVHGGRSQHSSSAGAPATCTSAERAAPDLMTQLEDYVRLRDEASSLLGAVAEALVDALDGPQGPHSQPLDVALGPLFGQLHTLRARHAQAALSVAVLALAKAGKSTLINALLGVELLPVNNVPETARICRVSHAPRTECPEPQLLVPPSRTSSTGLSAAQVAGEAELLVPGVDSNCEDNTNTGTAPEESGGGALVVRGVGAVREALRELHAAVRSREHTSGDEELLDITATLAALDGNLPVASADDSTGSRAAAVPGHDVRLCLLDTPGPNEAGEESLKYQVERLLSRVDAVLYVLDYTKLKTAEEEVVLGRLAALNPALLSRLCSRLFFVVNKFDQAAEGTGMGADDTRHYVATLITQSLLGVPGFKLHPDQVLLLSARDGLLSRLVLSDAADTAATARFSRLAFGAFATRAAASAARSPALMSSAAAELLERSGLPELEQRVLTFLCEAAGGVKLLAVLDDAGSLLDQLSNVAGSAAAALAADAARLSASREALQAELNATLASFDGVTAATQELQIEAVDELRAHLGNLRERLVSSIQATLLPPPEAAAGAAGAATGAAGATAAPTHPTNDSSSTATGVAAGGGGGGASDGDAADAAAGPADRSRQRRGHRRHGCHRRHRRHRRRSFSGDGDGDAGGENAWQPPGMAWATGTCPGGIWAAAATATATNTSSSSWFAGGGGGSGGGGSSSSDNDDDYDDEASARAAGSVQNEPPRTIPASALSRGWAALRVHLLALLGRNGATGDSAGSAASSGSSSSRDEVASALIDLSEQIMQQVQEEVAAAWHVMEAATNARAGRLVGSLNAQLATLSARLEGAVEDGLQVRLAPVSLSLTPPDALTFHADLTALIEAGVAASPARHVRNGERTEMVWEARRGACRLTNYYVQVPRRRRIVETYTTTSYSLNPDAIARHFVSVVDEAISTTEHQLASYVRHYVDGRVSAAREAVEAYGGRYLSTMSAALEAAAAGADERSIALERAQAYCTTIAALRARLCALAERAELLVPHNTSSLGTFERLAPVYSSEEDDEEDEDNEANQVAATTPPDGLARSRCCTDAGASGGKSDDNDGGDHDADGSELHSAASELDDADEADCKALLDGADTQSAAVAVAAAAPERGTSGDTSTTAAPLGTLQMLGLPTMAAAAAGQQEPSPVLPGEVMGAVLAEEPVVCDSAVMWPPPPLILDASAVAGARQLLPQSPLQQQQQQQELDSAEAGSPVDSNGTARTAASHASAATPSSGMSRAAEHLANSLLSAPAATPAAGTATTTTQRCIAVAGSGADDPPPPALAPPPQLVNLVNASCCAPILAQHEDGSGASDGNGTGSGGGSACSFDLRSSFAAALTAAGLDVQHQQQDGVHLHDGTTPSSHHSEEWQLVGGTDDHEEDGECRSQGSVAAKPRPQ